ncbi:hypothetical protein [Krasilnikovia sp. MM14-A1259]|uniref:hypothetical protein n=1 Tax=Krasilnikovia sp. MM14-A1259 TaxID=3373539 RepID=UPI00399C7080
MALIAYDHADADAIEATRHLGDDAVGAWREAIARHPDPRPGSAPPHGPQLTR